MSAMLSLFQNGRERAGHKPFLMIIFYKRRFRQHSKQRNNDVFYLQNPLGRRQKTTSFQLISYFFFINLVPIPKL